MQKRPDERQIRGVIAKRMEGADAGSSGVNNWISARKKALSYYFGEGFGNEEAGRSSVVSRDVAEVVDGAMPSLMRVFFGGEDIVRCQPKGMDDAEKAEQSNDYISHVLNAKNDGFTVFYDWCKDGLIGRLGLVKLHWQENEAPPMEEYEGLDEEEALNLDAADVGDDRYEVAKPVQGGYVKIEHFNVEEFYVSSTAKSAKTAPIIGHGRVVTRSDILEMGYKLDGAETTTNVNHEDESGEILIRNRGDIAPDMGEDDASDGMFLFDGYTKLDKDGTGIERLYRIVFIGKDCQRLLACEPADGIDIYPWTPVRVPGRLVGKSLADDVLDIQEIKSMALRGSVDGLALMNNPRRYVVDAKANLADLIANKIGQVIRVKESGAVQAESQGDSLTAGLSLTEYMDGVRQDRTGIRPVSSLDSDAINAYSQTARGAEIANDAANDRLELIARTFAETGIVPMVKGILRLGKKHETQAVFATINDEPRQLDPANFDPDLDVIVKVGLGASDRRSRIAKADGLFALTQQVVTMQGGLSGPFIDEKNAYNVIAEAVKARGYRNVSAFVTKPPDKDTNAPPEPEPPNHAVMELQAKIQLQQQELQAKAQMSEQEFQFKVKIAAADREAKSQEAVAKMQQDYDLAMAKIKADTEARNAQIQAEISLKLRQMDAEIALKRELAALGLASGGAGNLSAGDVQFGGEPG